MSLPSSNPKDNDDQTEDKKKGLSLGIKKKRDENSRIEEDTEKQAMNVLSISH